MTVSEGCDWLRGVALSRAITRFLHFNILLLIFLVRKVAQFHHVDKDLARDILCIPLVLIRFGCALTWSHTTPQPRNEIELYTRVLYYIITAVKCHAMVP